MSKKNASILKEHRTGEKRVILLPIGFLQYDLTHFVSVAGDNDPNYKWVKSSVPEGMQLGALYIDYDRTALREDSSRIVAIGRKFPKESAHKGVIH